MIALSVKDLSLSFGTNTILDKITFALNEGDRAGLVGVNGCGKSTLLRLISGRYTADGGEIYIAKDRRIGLLEQDDSFHEITSVGERAIGTSLLEQMYAAFPELLTAEGRMETIQKHLDAATDHASAEYLRLCEEYAAVNARYIEGGGLEFRGRCAAFLVKLGFPAAMHTLDISALSGGQRTRLALARLLARECDILMLDEPTNHLDLDTVLWLEQHLKAFKKTLLIVSHDRLFLDRVTNKTLEVEHHAAKLYPVSYSGYVKQKEVDREIAERHYKNQQREIARIEAYIAQQRQWNRERNIIAAESREKQLEKMERVERPTDLPKSIRFAFRPCSESGNDVLRVRDLSMRFGEKTLFSGLSFDVKKGEHVFIAGANGTGKSTLVKILMGLLHPTGGLFEYGYNVKIGYYDQENQNLTEGNTVLDELWNEYPMLTQTEIRDALAAFLFRGDDITKPVSGLSGGERARLTLTKMVLGEMNLLILDEPTNHLDIQSREALERALSAFPGTIIAVSHDRYFADTLATRVINVTPGIAPRLFDYSGKYSEYLDLQASLALSEEPASAAGASEVSAAKESYLQTKQKNAERRRAEKQRQQRKEEITRLEAELDAVDRELYGDAAADYVRAAELDARKTEIEERLLFLYEEEENE